MKHLHILDTLARVKAPKRKTLLQGADFELIKSITECVENVLNGNVKLDNKQLKKLKRYKSHLRKVRSASKKWTSKKKVIIQSGGAFLAPLLLPIIGAIAAKYV